MAANEVIRLSELREREDTGLVEPMEFSDELPAGTLLLNKQYTITGYLNSGGFGITYVAKDSLNRSVVIKECFPGFMCRRVGKDVHVRSLEHRGELASIVDAFINEARALAALNHKGIVKVHQVFEENQTAYMAMDYVKGLDLADVIERHPGALSPSRVVRMTRRILHVVSYVHQRGILHRDISPDNILIAKNGEPMLIDFGSAYEHIKKAGTETAQMKFVKDGYSPQEFYLPDGDQGPWSDIYSLAATLYHLISGAAPAAAQPRLAALAKGNADPYEPLHGAIDGYPPKFLKAIDKALALMPEERFQTAEEWMARITKRMPVSSKPTATGIADLLDAELPEHTSIAGAAHANAPATDDEEGLMAAVQVAADLREANIRTILNDADEPTQSSRLPLFAVTGLTLALGVGAIGYLQFAGQSESAATITPPLVIQQPQPSSTPQPTATAQITQPEPVGIATQSAEPVVLAAPAAQTLGEIASQTVPVQPASAPKLPEPQDGSAVAMGIFAAQPAGQFPNAPLVLQASEQGSAVDAPLLPTTLRLNAIAAAQAALPKISDIPPKVQRIARAALPAPAAAAELPATLPEAEVIQAKFVQPGAAPAITRQTDSPVTADFTAPDPLPEPVILGPVLANQIAFSHWDVDMPFVTEMQKQRNAATALVTQLSPDADFTVAGSWITEGTRMFTYNGQTLDVNTELSMRVLNAMMIDPDGYTRGTVRYRDPVSGQIDRGLLAVPVVREIGLADGTQLQGRFMNDAWRFSVIATAQTPAPEGLEVGDRLVQETTTGIEITTHDDLARLYERLLGRAATVASFKVERAGQVLNVTQPLARATEGQP